MRPRRAADLEPGKLYSRRALRELGMHPRVLASAEISTPVAGYCTRSDEPAALARVAGLVQQVIVSGAVISHATAAEILEIPLPKALTHAHGAPMHCLTEEKRLRRARSTLVVHSGSTARTIRCRGVELAPPLTVLQQIASELSHEELVVGIDALVARRHGAVVHIPLARVRLESARMRGRGAAAVRRAAIDARENVWSPMETRARLLMVGEGFPEPVPNQLVREAETGKVYYIDLAYPAQKIAVEYDSEEHRLNKTQWRKDLHKNEVLHQLGWSVLRITVKDVREPADFFLRLAAAMSADAA